MKNCTKYLSIGQIFFKVGTPNWTLNECSFISNFLLDINQDLDLGTGSNLIVRQLFDGFLS